MTSPSEVPACITRDRLTSPWFPNTSRALLLAIVTAGIVFGLTSFHRLNHTDLWGHLNFGRWIAEHGSLPTSDPFAATPVNQPMLHSAWLSQLIGYEVQHNFGNEGLAFGHALLVTLLSVVLMLAVYRRGTSPSLVWTAGTLVFVLGLPVLGTIRPQLFGMLGAALTLLACSDLITKRQPLFWLPVVMILWANLHGSVLMGLAILGLFALGMTYEVLREADWNFGKAVKDGRLSRAWLAVIVSVAASCVNPHGPALLTRTIFFGEHAALQYISEWRALSPKSLTGVLMIVSSIAAGLLIKHSPRKWQAYEYLLLVFFALLTLNAIRMLAWWALVCPWVIVPHFAAYWAAHRQKSDLPAEPADEPTSMATLIAVGFAFTVLIISPSTYSMLTGRVRGPAECLVTDTPIYIADEVLRRNLDGNITAPMDWSDYLIWETNGQLRPLVYSHVHLTNKETWDSYVKIYTGDPSWLTHLQAAKSRYLVVNKSRSPELAKQLLLSERSGKGDVWVFYQDQKSLMAEIRLPEKTETKPAAAATSAIEPPVVEVPNS
ncbi:hypothetical protein ETAA8_03500 [Anatilimnocola aggregata]|uniref:Glycosyltransferase RgtA/B/C/D-like domain-containing protein n=1 Tax=Anatilimnocola aggregata TaxID=2528021 RepID=A0A517Y513_9BACT|nr:hypothetical protein [Anatilimnocola aggregata]QDU25286.1 hypothetical protein ETAA8_03500 [Anatilimnocola aggregata]